MRQTNEQNFRRVREYAVGVAPGAFFTSADLCAALNLSTGQARHILSSLEFGGVLIAQRENARYTSKRYAMPQALRLEIKAQTMTASQIDSIKNVFRRKLHDLGADALAVFMLKYYEKMNDVEIAAALNLERREVEAIAERVDAYCRKFCELTKCEIGEAAIVNASN